MCSLNLKIDAQKITPEDYINRFKEIAMEEIKTQDIDPMSKLKKTWIPALGGSLGFLVGMIGVKILG